jgi:hypothetical protein
MSMSSLGDPDYANMEEPKEYMFSLPIGDWSGDGHDNCNYYYVKSAKPVEEVREAHFRIKEVTGVDIHDICREYEDTFIDRDDYEKLRLLFDFKADDHDDDYPKEERIGMNPDDMVKLWILLLNRVDKSLNLVKCEESQMLPFYGFDEKGRHIGFVGYGTMGD